MRLLSSKNLGFFDLEGEATIPYAIISHRWYGDHEEVSYQEMLNHEGIQKPGFEKIKKCGEIARDRGYQYFWIDTCCIDKTSSSELLESINSMYLWYQNANVCYVYLSDVPSASSSGSRSLFKNSKWFSRGWTLQELIAPEELEFISKEWEFLGSKNDLKGPIHEITGIPITALEGESPDHFSIAERMSWASKRETKRIEDRAYSLLGLFGVNMPLLYGEKDKAFIRLQEEIMKRSDDQSLFAWKDPALHPERHIGLLASSPDMFMASKNINSMAIWHKGDAFASTNKGLRLQLFLIPHDLAAGVYRGSLECWVGGSQNKNAVIYLKRLSGREDDWGSSSMTQFARIHGNRVANLSSWQKQGGAHRVIYIRENPAAGQNQLRELSGNNYKNFRIQPICLYPIGHEYTADMSVYPRECWDLQTSIFTTSVASGNLGGISFEHKGVNLLTVFGVSPVGIPWIKIIEHQNEATTEQAWRSFKPKGNEGLSSDVFPNENQFIGCSATIATTAMYGTCLYVISHTELYIK